MKILVTGGAGYIGSHTTLELLEYGFDVVCIDNESNAKPDVIQRVELLAGKSVNYYKGDIRDKSFLKSVWQESGTIDGVIHFAALKSVEESTKNPLDYFNVNISGWINVLQTASDFNTHCILFSSSCTVYGNPELLPVTEATPFGIAESPYGLTKQIGEQLLERTCNSSKNTKGISLRYFNPAGAHHSGVIGEDAKKISLNLVPVLMELAFDKRDTLTVFGTDYATRDGSCIRDYIHVTDLAKGHVKAMNYMLDKMTDPYDTFNLGDGQGTTVIEAVAAAEQYLNKKLNIKYGPRRPGDVESIYADTMKSKEILKWETIYDINDIISTAHKWELKRDE